MKSSVHEVFSYLATDEGRELFWVEKSVRIDDTIEMTFPNGFKWKATIIEEIKKEKLKIIYIDNSITTFQLSPDNKGTILKLTDELQNDEYHNEISAGWVSVLMILKGAVDFGIDLRNHNQSETWDQGFVNN